MTTADGSVLGTSQIAGSAPRANAFNVVVLAEGFQGSEQAAFEAAAQTFASTLLSTPPYTHLAPAINVFRVDVSSTDSGAGDPVATGGTGASPHTYFDATFGAGGIRRLLVCNTATALSVAAAQVPEFSLCLLIVNSTVYGGSGGGVGTFSLAPGAMEIALHEMGHTAFHLADEYEYWAGGNETGHDHHTAVEPAQPNVTVNSDRATLKWTWAVAATTPLPTMANPDCTVIDTRPNPFSADTVGLYEGADYFHCGAYRPQHDCRMKALGFPYCQVCQSVINDRIGSLAALLASPQVPITAVARYPEHIDVFAVASDGRTMSEWWDAATGWASWFQVSGGVSSPGSPVTAIARYAGHLDLFTVGTDNRVWSTWWDASSGWASWFQVGSLQARPGATVNVVARYSDHLDLFTTGSAGEVMSTWWDAHTGWADWFQVSGGVAAPGATVTAIARYPFHLDLFTVGTDNRVWSTWWDDRSGWAAWFQVGSLVARPDSTVNVVARYPDHLDLFTTGSAGEVMSAWWDARSGWADWFQVSGGVASAGSPVSAVSRTQEHLDLFTVGTDNRIWSTWWDGATGWNPAWFVVSGGVSQAGAAVNVLSRVRDHLDLFAVGNDGHVWSSWWDAASGWASWFLLTV